MKYLESSLKKYFNTKQEFKNKNFFFNLVEIDWMGGKKVGVKFEEGVIFRILNACRCTII